MANFIHIADEKNAKSIQRNGLLLPRWKPHFAETEIVRYGIFALPVVSNFMITLQWVRELKRSGFNVAVGVYFRIPDEEAVWAGAYNQPKQLVSAAKATAMLSESDALGFEVIIPRTIKPSEIRHVRAIPQGIGWRYFPQAKGKPPFCGCSYCQRGNIKSKRLQTQYKEREAQPEIEGP